MILGRTCGHLNVFTGGESSGILNRRADAEHIASLVGSLSAGNRSARLQLSIVQISVESSHRTNDHYFLFHEIVFDPRFERHSDHVADFEVLLLDRRRIGDRRLKLHCIPARRTRVDSLKSRNYFSGDQKTPSVRNTKFFK